MNIEKFRKFLDELEVQVWKDESGRTVAEEGYKYSKNFWNYYNEKQFCIQHMDLDGVETVCDIGAGVGLLGVLLNQWYDIEVEATDVKATFDGGIFQQMFAKMKTPRHLLEIKNKKLRKEIESIYTKQEERVSGMALLTKEVTENIADWFEFEKNKFDKDVSNTEIFNNYKNQKLKNLINRNRNLLSARVNDIENYLQALNNVVLLISSEYKQLD